MINSRFAPLLGLRKRPTYYLADGLIRPSEVEAVYQPYQAESYAKSLINIANPGVHDAYLGSGTAPGWTAEEGWIGTGTQHLKTDVMATSDKTVVIKYTGRVDTGWAIVGAEATSKFNIAAYNAQWGSGEGGGSAASAWMALGRTYYKNRTLAWTADEQTFDVGVPFYIFTRNKDGVDSLVTAKIEFLAIYNIRLTEAQYFGIIDAYEKRYYAEGPALTVEGETTLVTGGTLDWHGRPVCAVQDGVTIMVYRTGSQHDVNDGALHIRFSDDYGETWTADDTTLGDDAVTNFPMNPPDLDEGEDANEPLLIIAPNGDLLLMMWKINWYGDIHGPYMARSTDGGETWGAAAAVTIVDLPEGDVIWSTTDDYFVVGSTIYAGATSINDDDNAHNIFITSTDNGTTWTYISSVSADSTNEIGLVYLGSDDILAVMRASAGTATYQSTSTNMGETWSALSDISYMVGTSGRHRIATVKQLKLESDWWTDTHLIMWGFERSGSTIRRTTVWLSDDSGATWHAKNVDGWYDDAGYGDMFYNPDTGHYILLCYRGDNSEADVIQYELSVSWP